MRRALCWGNACAAVACVLSAHRQPRPMPAQTRGMRIISVARSTAMSIPSLRRDPASLIAVLIVPRSERRRNERCTIAVIGETIASCGRRATRQTGDAGAEKLPCGECSARSREPRAFGIARTERKRRTFAAAVFALLMGGMTPDEGVRHRSVGKACTYMFIRHLAREGKVSKSGLQVILPATMVASLLDAYLAACKASGERPREDLAAALGDSDGDGCFRLSGLALVRSSAAAHDAREPPCRPPRRTLCQLSAAALSAPRACALLLRRRRLCPLPPSLSAAAVAAATAAAAAAAATAAAAAAAPAPARHCGPRAHTGRSRPRPRRLAGTRARPCLTMLCTCVRAYVRAAERLRCCVRRRGA